MIVKTILAPYFSCAFVHRQSVLTFMHLAMYKYTQKHCAKIIFIIFLFIINFYKLLFSLISNTYTFFTQFLNMAIFAIQFSLLKDLTEENCFFENRIDLEILILVFPAMTRHRRVPRREWVN